MVGHIQWYYKFYWLSKHFINVEHIWDWGLFLLKFIILLKLVEDGQSTKNVILTDPDTLEGRSLKMSKI